jgi:di/tripeptidase
MHHPEDQAWQQLPVAFTPDEEIGNGPKYFDVKKFAR